MSYLQEAQKLLCLLYPGKGWDDVRLLTNLQDCNANGFQGQILCIKEQGKSKVLYASKEVLSAGFAVFLAALAYKATELLTPISKQLAEREQELQSDLAKIAELKVSEEETLLREKHARYEHLIRRGILVLRTKHALALDRAALQLLKDHKIARHGYCRFLALERNLASYDESLDIIVKEAAWWSLSVRKMHAGVLLQHSPNLERYVKFFLDRMNLILELHNKKPVKMLT